MGLQLHIDDPWLEGSGLSNDLVVRKKSFSKVFRSLASVLSIRKRSVLQKIVITGKNARENVCFPLKDFDKDRQIEDE